ncbi:hypothetical protein IWZ00DRAFT_220664 [Phyllosticta capitalensis]
MASKATASMTPTQLGTLGKLPVELRLEIFKQLDYGSAIFLAATNRYFRSMIDPLSQISDADKTAFLRRAEHFAQHEPPSGKGLACYGCFRVKQENLFEPGLYSGSESCRRRSWTADATSETGTRHGSFVLRARKSQRSFITALGQSMPWAFTGFKFGVAISVICLARRSCTPKVAAAAVTVLWSLKRPLFPICVLRARALFCEKTGHESSGLRRARSDKGIFEITKENL